MQEETISLKFILLLLVMLISSITLSAQRELNINEIAEHICNGIINNYHPDSIALTKCCRKGAVFIKFKVNQNGEITDLAFSKGSSAIIPASLKLKEGDNKDSPVFITDALTKAVEALQLDTALINALKKSGRTIIQPFIYINLAGCKFPKITASSTAEDRVNFYPDYIKVMSNMDKILPSIMSLLNFNDGRILALDGILLSSIQVGSGGME